MGTVVLNQSNFDKSDFELLNAGKATKRAISEKEMRAIATLQLPEGTSIAFARDVFMFSFYMRGMPFVDIAYLRKKDLRNKMLAYSRKKTNQYLTVEWVKEAQEIID